MTSPLTGSPRYLLQVYGSHQGRQTGRCLAALLWAGSFSVSEPVPSHAGLGFQSSGKTRLDLRDRGLRFRTMRKSWVQGFLASSHGTRSVPGGHARDLPLPRQLPTILQSQPSSLQRSFWKSSLLVTEAPAFQPEPFLTLKPEPP